MTLAQFITSHSATVIAEWEEFARTCFPQSSLLERRDHIQGMLNAIVVDLGQPETAREKSDKAKGLGDSHVDSPTAANAHGSDRAANGYTLVQMVSEFRALRASVLRLWSKGKTDCQTTDLDEVTRFNESIDQMLAESAKKYSQDVDRSKDLLIGVLGHDLRNPLGAIMMSAEVIKRRAAPDWPHFRETSRILASSRRMDTMIGDLLDFTRTRLGSGIPIIRADMDLESVCRQAVDEVTSFHPGCVVHFQASGDLRGRWDQGRIAQALSNLVGNAYQHGAEGEAVDVVLQGESDEEVVLAVHNQGIPIPPDALDEIFSPFRQLQPEMAKSQTLRSLGLGLYIAQTIATAHGGTLHGRIDAEGRNDLHDAAKTLFVDRNDHHATVSRRSGAMVTLRDWLSAGPFTLAMSSGFFGFYAHAGFLSVLEQEGLLPARVCGSSAGALVAGLWAAGLSAPRIQAELLALRRPHFWDVRPGFGLLRGALFRARLEALAPVQSFADCRVPLAISVFDVWARRTTVLSAGNLAAAVHASCAAPSCFSQSGLASASTSTAASSTARALRVPRPASGSFSIT